MDFYAASQPYLFTAVLLVWIVLSFTSARAFLFLTGMLTTILVPRIDIGVNVDWYRILGPLALALLLLRRKRIKASPPSGLGPFLWYATVVSVVWMVIEYTVMRRYVGAQAMGLGAMQAYYKMPVQLGSFLGQSLIFYVVPTRAKNRTEAMAAIHGYAFGIFLSFAFGIVLYLVTGQGMLAKRGAGMLEIEGIGFSRIGGLSGEPKFLGILVAILLMWELSGLVFKGGRPVIFLVAAAALFLTLSTSAWAGTIVGMATVLAICLRHPLRTNWRTWSLIGTGVVVLALVGTILGAVMSKRLTGRLFGDTSEVSRQKDAYLIEAFMAEPINLLWGFGLGGGDLEVIPYVPPEELVYQRTPTPGVTGARVIGDLGLIGLALLLAAAWRWSKYLAARGHLQGAAFALGGLVTIFFGSLPALTGYLLVMSAVLVITRLPPEAVPRERARGAQPAPRVRRPA